MKQKKGLALVHPERRREIARMGGLSTRGLSYRRGFAAMTRKQRSIIGKKGAAGLHAAGKAHRWTSEEAREAGRKGGKKRWETDDSRSQSIERQDA